MSLDSLMTHTVEVQEPTNVTDASGGTTKTFAALPGYEEVPANIQPVSARDRVIFAQRNVPITHHAYLPISVPLERDHRLVVLSGPSSGQTLLVKTVFDMAGQGRAWKCECVEWAN